MNKTQLTLLLVFASWLVSISSLVNAQTQLWGMTSGGGQYGAGTIFNTDSSGNNETVQYNLFQHDGSKPLFTNLMQASDGMLYGMTSLGGANDSGLLFQYDPATSIYTKKIDFNGVNGSKPLGSLMQASDGMIYGMTYKGGAYSKGVLFQFNPVTSSYTKKLDFDGSTTGCYPHGSLIQASDGMLYGLAVQGGANDMGVLFQYNPVTSTFTKKLDFAGTTNGSYPLGSLMLASDGMLYGFSVQGGIYDWGVLFKYDPSTSTLTKKFDFSGIADGGNPLGFLIQANDGNLYGLASRGGANDKGVLFQYDPTNSIYSRKMDFDSINGSYPYGSLIQAKDGNLYGLTIGGGAYDSGILFQYNYSTSSFANKLDFAGSTTGSFPYGSLMQASDGNLYGMTNRGGENGIGVLFQYNPVASTFLKKFDFGAANGRYPHGSLIQASDGNLYGMTYQGGANDMGVLFQYNPATLSYTKSVDFDGTEYGRNPYGSLIQANDGNLYGMTYAGGTNDTNTGVLFQYNPATLTLTKKFDFSQTNGSNPYGSLIQANDGNLYGLTYAGGANNLGVLFQFDPATTTFTNKFNFDGTTNGSNPYGSLIQAVDGNLYGMTNQGGANNSGVLFQFNPVTSVYIKKLDFAGATNGSNPYGSLIQTGDGNLYGMTYGGGVNNSGVLFQYNPATSVCTKKLDFTGVANGSNPYGSLIKGSDGNLYGMTYEGGANNLGVLFQYNPISSAYIKKLDYNGTNGKYPYSNLTEVTINQAGIADYSDLTDQISIFPNPNKGRFTIQSKNEGMYSLVNTLGQTIQSFKLNATNNYNTSISNLGNGIYFVIGFNHNHITKQKIVVTK